LIRGPSTIPDRRIFPKKVVSLPDSRSKNWDVKAKQLRFHVKGDNHAPRAKRKAATGSPSAAYECQILGETNGLQGCKGEESLGRVQREQWEKEERGVIVGDQVCRARKGLKNDKKLQASSVLIPYQKRLRTHPFLVTDKTGSKILSHEAAKPKGIQKGRSKE